jgi:hypothetical protein
MHTIIKAILFSDGKSNVFRILRNCAVFAFQFIACVSAAPCQHLTVAVALAPHPLERKQST